jgi:hypothetical protein
MGILKKVLEYYRSINPNLSFIFWLLLFSVVYDYPSILLKRPQSVHHWRQSDCASLALNYYQTGMHFFQPQTHNLTSDNNTTGYCATSEIPVGYYFIAILYKVFGYHDFIFRLVNTLIFLLGLFYLFKIFYLFSGSTFWSTTIALFFFTSPVLVYYGNNFLTDSSALAFSFIAWYFFLRFYMDKRQKLFYLSMFFFLLAGTYKITALISLVVIVCVFIADTTRILKFNNGNKIFTKPVLNAIPFLLIFIIIGSWVYFAKNYNSFHGSGYFSTGIFPLWDLDTIKIQMVVKNIRELWLNQYFHVYSLYFFAIAFFVALVFIKKADRFLMVSNLLLFLGVSIYAILWFWTFKDHDYYTINLYILLVFILLNFVWLFKNYFPKTLSSSLLKILFFCFLLFNMNHARKQMKERYNGWWTEYPAYKDYHVIIPYLRSIGIAPLDTVVCLPDASHFTLYLMNQRGWTECLGNNSDSSSIASSINHGAKYLIINGDDAIKRDYLQSFLNIQIGQFNNIKIFKLKKSDPTN